MVARGDVRRAKLYYLRGRVGKRARVAERRWGIEEEELLGVGEELEAVDSEGVAVSEAETVAPKDEGEGEGEEVAGGAEAEAPTPEESEEGEETSATDAPPGGESEGGEAGGARRPPDASVPSASTPDARHRSASVPRSTGGEEG